MNILNDHEKRISILKSTTRAVKPETIPGDKVYEYVIKFRKMSDDIELLVSMDGHEDFHVLEMKLDPSETTIYHIQLKRKPPPKKYKIKGIVSDSRNSTILLAL